MKLASQLKTIPEKPGCYLYFNKDDKVIYVGKAKNLKKRVNSYFNKAHNFKTTKLVREIFKLETIITDNEKESLLLEQNLIKKYKPRFNIVLNDDKSYPYIAITNEKDPMYLYTRNYDRKNKISFGPLPDGTSARNIMRTLERIYPLRRCKGNLNKPCIHYHINQCSGACFKEVDKDYYDKQIRLVQDFFDGKSTDVKEKLQQKMFLASENLQFEEAQRIKEIIRHMEFTLIQQSVDLNDNLNRDVFNYFEYDNYICFTVLFYRGGKLALKDQDIFKYEGQNIFEMMKSFVMQIYAKNILSDYIILPSEIELDDLKQLFGNKVLDENDTISKKLLDLAKKNAQEFLYQKINYSDQNVLTKEELLTELQNTLNLPKFPSHIEMYDVANILDEFVTGAMVVFKQGVPSKNDFRKYNIDIEHPDDYHRMQNMIERRYSKDKDDHDKWADLIITDGGIIQVNAARETLNKLGINIPIIGLVKNDHHKTEYIFNHDNQKIYLEKNTQLFKMLESFQMRVHNFAISGFRKRQSNNLLKDDLVANVKGLGPTTAKKLYESFLTLKNIKAASFDELLAIIKNKQTTKNLFEYLGKEEANEK